jgi:hypothetical protein
MEKRNKHPEWRSRNGQLLTSPSDLQDQQAQRRHRMRMGALNPVCGHKRRGISTCRTMTTGKKLAESRNAWSLKFMRVRIRRVQGSMGLCVRIHWSDGDGIHIRT